MSESELIARWTEYFPIMAAVLIVLLGWIVGRVARHLVASAVPRVNRMSVRWGAQPEIILTPAFTQVLQVLVFWIILTASIILGLHMVGGGSLSQWLDGLLHLAPQLLVALGILALGHILGLLARNLLGSLSHSPGKNVLLRTVYGIFVGIAAVTALKHLGLDLTFVTQILLVIISVFFAGLGLAFALGAKTLVANLVAQTELQRYKPGDRLLIDGIEGTVQEIHRTCMVLSTAQGLASIPAAKFAEAIVIKPLPAAVEDE